MDNRTILLTCALELFAARGYDAVGVQEVVEAAKVTKPTLYHYYGSKLGLLKALFETYHSELDEAVKAAAATYNEYLPGVLETLAGVYFDFARRYPVYYRLQLALYFAPRDSEANSVAAAWNYRQHEVLEELFKRATRRYGNMAGRQAMIAAAFVGQINTAIGMWLNGYADLDEELLHKVVRQFQYGIYS